MSRVLPSNAKNPNRLQSPAAGMQRYRVRPRDEMLLLVILLVIFLFFKVVHVAIATTEVFLLF